MSGICDQLHSWVGLLQRRAFPFNDGELPPNGIYFLFEKGECGHGTDRIVRVGTHTGQHQLCSRLRQHFILEKKDRSIFRKNIGRAIHHREENPLLSQWELDLTSAESWRQHSPNADMAWQNRFEGRVSQCIRDHFAFATIEIIARVERLHFESRLMSTVSACEACAPSEEWLGHSHPVRRVRASGLWQVQHLGKVPLSREELMALRK